MAEKAYKFRLYPTAEQAEQMQRTFGCVRKVFNVFLDRRITAYKASGENLTYNACAAELTELKKELTYLQEVDSTALQSALRNLDRAYCNFFRRVRNGEKPGFPRFKSKRNSRKSYRSPQNGGSISLGEGTIKLPKLGNVRVVIATPVKGRILNATVSQSPSGKYFVSLCCSEVEIEQYPHTGAVVGIDLGLKTAVTTSDDDTFENHRYLQRSEQKLKREQRRLSRKPKGSNNREKQRIRLARVHEKIANQRANALHQITTKLVRENDIICIEDLVVSNMLKNHRLSKAISDVSWSELRRQLEYKCLWHGRKLQLVDRFYPSSQTCSMCGAKNEAVKGLGVRGWVCSECGSSHDRDANAAKNILAEGLRLLAASD